MNIILVLIPVTLVVIGIAVALFFWAVNHQQFDDLDSPGIVPLLEDDPDRDVHDREAASSTVEDAEPADASVPSSPRTPPPD